MVFVWVLVVTLWSAVAVTFRRLLRGGFHPLWNWQLELFVRVARWGALRAARARPADVRKMLRPARLVAPIASRVEVGASALGSCDTEVITPTGWPDDGPVILYVHGGGYAICSPGTHRDLVARIAIASGARCVTIDYALSPEHPFPIALDQCEQGYRALAGEVEPGRLYLAGDSAGGGLCLGVLQRLRDAGDTMPAGALLLSPWVDLCCTGDSIQRNARYDYLQLEVLQSFARHYLQDADPADPLVSPLYADLQGFPPLLVHVGGAEAIRAEIEQFADRGRSFGVDVTLYIGEGMVHGWHALAPFVREARRDIRALGQFVRERHGAAEAAARAQRSA